MFCPNCGREVTGKFCPACGTRLGAAPASAPSNGAPRNAASAPIQNAPQTQSYGQAMNYPKSQSYVSQPFASGFAYNQNANPGYVPNQGYNPGQQVTGSYRDIPPGAAGQDPGSLLLRRLASSPLMLIAAILASLYVLSMGYLCGKEIVNLIGQIGDHYKYFTTTQKISSIISIVTCFVHAVMVLWLLIAVWELFGSASGRGRIAMSFSGLRACKAYARARELLFFVPALAAVISLAIEIAKMESSDFSYALLSLTANCSTHDGFQAITVIFTKDAIVVLSILTVLFLMAAARSSLLATVCDSSVRMLRYGGPQQRRLVPAAVLTLLRGLILIAGGIYMLVEYGKHYQFDGILLIASFMAVGLASCFVAALLFRNAALIRRLRGY